jgi:hypothetical protein
MLLTPLAVLASLVGLGVAGCSQGRAQPEKQPPMTNPLAPSHADLEQAYRMHEPLRAGIQGAEALVVTGAASDETITVLATQNLDGDGDHTWLIALDPAGNVRWERHLDAKYGFGHAIAAFPNGGFAIAGEVQRGSMAFQAVLVCTDAKGEVTVAKTLGPPGVTGFNSVAVRPDGSLIAGGSAVSKGWLVTVDPAITRPGERSFEVEDIKNVGVLASGDIVALARVQLSTIGFDHSRIAAVKPTTGQVAWDVLLPSTGLGDPAALVVTHDGMLAVGSGAAEERSPSRIWLARLDAAGAIRWEHTLADDHVEWRAFGATAAPDGFAIVGRTIPPSSFEFTTHVWRLNDDGAIRWDSDIAIPGGGHADEYGHTIAALHDGSLVLAGHIARGGPGKLNVWIVRLAPDGKVLWQKMLGSPATSG